MLLERFELTPEEHLHGHHHAHVHLCIVRQGALSEHWRAAWQTCDTGSVRVSPGGVAHDIRVHGDGAQGHIVELPHPVVAGLARPLRDSIFLSEEQSAAVLERFGTHRPIDLFTAECLALELVADAVLPSRSETPGWLFELRQELDTQPTARSLAVLARRYQRHPSHVARAFRERFGRSIGAHLQARRLEQARQRLCSSEEQIAGIAADFGFTDQAHFTRAFRQRFGAPPGRYRSHPVEAGEDMARSR